MNSAQHTAQDAINAAYAKWQRAIEKYHNPLITPTTAKRYLRAAEQAKAAYLAAKSAR
jgi:hypothetical protein